MQQTETMTEQVTRPAMEPMMETIDEVAWELATLARNTVTIRFLPKVLTEKLEDYAARLMLVYNEYCSLEENLIDTDEKESR